MRVCINRAILRTYVNRAVKHWPKEYGALLYGVVKGDDVVVTEVVNVPFLSGPSHFWYDRDKIEEERLAGKYLGTIHSHPDNFEFTSVAIPSTNDWAGAIKDDEVIHGICHVKVPGTRPRTYTAFYLGCPALLELKRT